MTTEEYKEWCVAHGEWPPAQEVLARLAAENKTLRVEVERLHAERELAKRTIARLTNERDARARSPSDYQQQRGAAWDIIDEALLAFDAFMQDDDYDYQRILYSIMEKMKARRALYSAHGEGRDRNE